MRLFSSKIFLAFSVFLLFFWLQSTEAKVCLYTNGAGQQCSEISTEGLTAEQQVELNNPAAIEKICEESYCREGNGNTNCRMADSCPIPLANPLRQIRKIGLGQPTGGSADIASIIGNVIESAVGVIGAITLLVFIYGGFLWLTSHGNEEKIRKGSGAMLYAAIGLFIIFGSYGILRFVFEGLGAQ